MSIEEPRFKSLKVYKDTHELMQKLNDRYKTGIAPGYHRAVLLLQKELEESPAQIRESSKDGHDLPTNPEKVPA